MDEFALIARFFAPLSANAPGAFGLSDDAALLTPLPGQSLVLTKDAMVAGVHFLPEDPPAEIARKLLRINLSDLAAKGATPLGYLMATAFPKDVTEAWLEAFALGLGADQAEFGITLLGGDTVATPGPLTLSLTALGTVPEGRMIRRFGAKPGDDLYVTGTIGDGVLGLAVLKGEALGLVAADQDWLATRYRLPQPRLALGRRLLPLAHAALDVSDGLIADLRHLAEVSGVRAVLQLGDMPLSPPAARWAHEDPARLMRLACGGDDYEILFAAPEDARAALAEAVAETATPICRIGRIEAGQGVEVQGAGDVPLDPRAEGYRHF